LEQAAKVYDMGLRDNSLDNQEMGLDQDMSRLHAQTRSYYFPADFLLAYYMLVDKKILPLHEAE
jgi:hypothetical protein